MKRPAPTINDKPVLDEASFQQLLSAAFVLQRHNERQLSGSEPEAGYSKTLATILEIQEHVRSRRLDMRATAVMIARRVREITAASGSAVGIVDDGHLEYYAASGSASSESGARASFDASLSEECLRKGQLLQCPDAEIDPLLNPELCRTLRVKAFLAAPIMCEGKVSGALELHFPQPNSIDEHDVRTCRVLAALLGDVLARDLRGETEASSEHVPSKSSAPDRAAMLAALERIKPQLERLVKPAVAATPAPIPEVAPEPASQPVSQPVAEPATLPVEPEVFCTSCGYRLGKEESLCGLCGAAQPSKPAADPEPPATATSPWSSLWDMQRTAEQKADADSLHHTADAPAAEHDPLEVLPSEMEKVVAHFAQHPEETDISKVPRVSSEVATTTAALPAPFSAPPASFSAMDPVAEEELPLPAFTSEADLDGKLEQTRKQHLEDYPDFSADMEADEPTDESLQSEARARELLEEEPSAGAGLAQMWHTQRANVYLGAAVLLLIAALFGWGSPDAPSANSSSPAPATAQQMAPPQPELSLFDKMLIGLGLAEAPSPPVNMGKPEIRVWIDTHTALYYCPGSELYGKTPGGRFTTQGDAQQDQFEPASRRVCQ